jgi:hypothetical protein
MGSDRVVIKDSDIRKVSDSVIMWYYVCPICGKKIMNDSLARTRLAARLHLMRKHKVEVVFE